MNFFSVITPSFNQGAYLETCIRSVLAQGEPDFEHWIYDNQSTDESATVAAKFPHLRFISERDRGQSDAVNKGFRSATGEIICWLNADDAYEVGAFAKIRAAFTDPTVKVVYGDARQVTYDGAGTIPAPAKFDSRLDLIRWWSPDVKLHQPAIFFRRSLLEEVGGLREDLHYALDYEFWWRVSERHAFHYLPEVLAIQHRQPESKTILAWDRVLRERERIFAPHYDLVTNYSRTQLDAERRQSLARIHLQDAFLGAAEQPARALRKFGQALRESPREALRWKNLGIFSRMLGFTPTQP